MVKAYVLGAEGNKRSCDWIRKAVLKAETSFLSFLQAKDSVCLLSKGIHEELRSSVPR